MSTTSDSDSDNLVKLMEEARNKLNIKKNVQNDKRSSKLMKVQLKRSSMDSSSDDSSDEETIRKPVPGKKNIKEEVIKAEEKLKKLNALKSANSDSSDISSDDEPKTPVSSKIYKRDENEAIMKKPTEPVSTISKLNSKLIQAANLSTRKDVLQKMITNSNDILDNIIKQKEIGTPKSILKRTKQIVQNEDSDETDIDRQILPLSQGNALKMRQSVGRDTSYMDTSFANVMSSTQIPKSQNSSSSSDEDSDSKTKPPVKKQAELKLRKMKVSSDSGHNSKSDSDSEPVNTQSIKPVSKVKTSPAMKKETEKKTTKKISIKAKESSEDTPDSSNKKSKDKAAKLKISPIKPIENYKKIDALKLLHNNVNNKKTSDSDESEPELFTSTQKTRNSDSSEEISCAQLTLSQKEALKSKERKERSSSLSTDVDSDSNAKSPPKANLINKINNQDTTSDSDSDDEQLKPKQANNDKKALSLDVLKSIIQQKNIPASSSSDSDSDEEKTSKSPQKNMAKDSSSSSDSEQSETKLSGNKSVSPQKSVKAKSSLKSSDSLSQNTKKPEVSIKNNEEISSSDSDESDVESKRNQSNFNSKNIASVLKQSNSSDSDSDSEQEVAPKKTQLNNITTSQKNNVNSQQQTDSDSDSEEETSTTKAKLINSRSTLKSKNMLQNSDSDKEQPIGTKSKSPQKITKQNALTAVYSSDSTSTSTNIKETKISKKIKCNKREHISDSDESPSKKQRNDISATERIHKLANLNVIQPKNIDETMHDTMKEFLISNPTLDKIDDVTKFVLSDLNEDEEVWLMQIPKNIDPNLMKGQHINFKQGKLKFKGSKVKYEYETQKSKANICLVASKSAKNKDLNAKSVKTNGTIIVHEALKHTSSDIKVPTKTKVQQPANLKVRHPIFGLDFQEKIELDEDITNKLLEAEIKKREAERKLEKKKRRKSIANAKEAEDSVNKDEMIFKLLQQTMEEINTKDKKNKKRKHENGNDSSLSPKKLKTDMQNSEISQIITNDTTYTSKSKKHKSHKKKQNKEKT